MKFGTGSNAERTQKYGGSKYKMTYIRPYICDRICEKGPYRAKANSEIKTKNAAWIIFSEI